MDRKKILFIEDEPDQIMIVKMRLEASGFDVVSAIDGEEGLKKAYEDKPDLILLDILIPKIDGLSLCRLLKGDPKRKNISIIIITASGGKELLERCQVIGADDLIIKPFKEKELIDKIAKYLNK